MLLGYASPLTWVRRESSSERVLGVSEKAGDDVGGLLAPSLGESLEALGVFTLDADEHDQCGVEVAVMLFDMASRAWPARRRNRRAADRGLSRDRCSSARSEQLTLGLGRIPASHDRPGGGINGPFDHECHCATSIRPADEEHARAAPTTSMWVADGDVAVARQLLGLPGGYATHPELVECDIGGEELMDHVASDRRGVPPAPDRPL